MHRESFVDLETPMFLSDFSCWCVNSVRWRSSRLCNSCFRYCWTSVAWRSIRDFSNSCLDDREETRREEMRWETSEVRSVTCVESLVSCRVVDILSIDVCSIWVLVEELDSLVRFDENDDLIDDVSRSRSIESDEIGSDPKRSYLIDSKFILFTF